MRTLYFDIDGVFLDYDDQPKSRLGEGVVPSLLDQGGFRRVVCVSSWVDLVAEALRIRWVPKEHFDEALLSGVWNRVSSTFPDFDWFADRVVLARENDHRGKHIDLNLDWYYCDDWADKFFCEHHPVDLYESELGRRIHLADPHDDGSGVLKWLESVCEKK